MRPTIRPVLDLSDLTGASTQIDSLFYPLRSIRLAGQASLAFQNASGENRMTVKVDNDDIIEELRTLRSEMAEMTERMERMRVVLDTGTLVGDDGGTMDNALGQRATRERKGELSRVSFHHHWREKHLDDWRLVPASRPVFNPPAQKVKTLEIPGGDGVIDLSQSLTGYPVYQNPGRALSSLS